ncbi:MAG: FumA C-terminus/TtdB family hydratase beta subunit [Oscillospiraceae bacterium]
MITKVAVENLRSIACTLKAGQKILLSGVVYTARDAAHKKLQTIIEQGEQLPFDLKDAVIYYSGPTPTPNGRIIGSCGPTTSVRMDSFTPMLMDKGLVGTIGKGERTAEVYEAVKRNGGVYLCALGGAGALMANSVKQCEVISFPELGCESVKRLVVEDMPLVVGCDLQGNNVFDMAKENFKKL